MLGTGLGLALVAAILEQHGGTLELSAASEGGLLAAMRLPVHMARPKPVHGSSHKLG